MANQAISQLPATISLIGNELVPVVQQGVTVRTTVADIAAFGANMPAASLSFQAPLQRQGNTVYVAGLSAAAANGLVYSANSASLGVTSAGVSGQVLVGSTGGPPFWTATIPGTAGVTSFNAGTTGLTPSTSATGAVTLGGTLVVASGGTGATTGDAAAVNLTHAYVAASVSAAKALTTRPPTVITEGYAAAGDGGGGPWAWVSGSVATANDITVLQPASGSAGRYLRIYSGGINVKWGGAAGDGVTDDTAAINAALTVGGHILFPNGTYLVSNITASVAGTTLEGLGYALLQDKSGVLSGSLLTMTGDHMEIFNLSINVTQSSGLTSGVLLQGNYCTIQDMVATGKIYNPILTNASYGYPGSVIRIQGNTPTLYQHNTLKNITVIGGRTGFLLTGGQFYDLTDLSVYNNGGQGIVVGNGLPFMNSRINGIRGVSCGLYALSLSNLISAAATIDLPVPNQGLQISNAHAFFCGAGSYYSDIQTSVGSAKYGFDITSTNFEQISFQGSATDCFNGGLENKRTQNPPITITPSTSSDVSIKLDCYQYRDYGQGVIVTMGDSLSPSTTLSRTKVEGTYALTGAPAWTSATLYQVFQTVSNDGTYWINFGDGNGNAGVSGGTPPTSGTSVIYTTTTPVSSGNTLNFADTTGIVSGMVVFGGANVPDQTIVSTVTATAITMNQSVTGLVSAQRVVFATTKSDGILNWMAFAADTTSAPTVSQGIQVASSTNVTIQNWTCYGPARGIILNPSFSTDNTISGLSIESSVIRNAQTGISTSGGSGNITAHLVGNDVEATNIALLLGFPGNVENISVYGGRYIGTTNSPPDAALKSNGSSSLALKLDGGVHIRGVYQAVNLITAGSGVGTAFVSATCGVATFENTTSGSGGGVVRLDGNGYWQWGQSAINNFVNLPGWITVSGGISVKGSPLRLDLTTAPTTSTKGNLGERLILGTPTSTEWGYVVTSTDLLTANVWKKMPLS